MNSQFPYFGCNSKNKEKSIGKFAVINTVIHKNVQ